MKFYAKLYLFSGKYYRDDSAGDVVDQQLANLYVVRMMMTMEGDCWRCFCSSCSMSLVPMLFALRSEMTSKTVGIKKNKVSFEA